jgi:hypothetical protein
MKAYGGVDIVAYLLKARTVEPEKEPLLANGSETTSVFRQRLGKHDPVATDTHATIQILYCWKHCFVTCHNLFVFNKIRVV